MGCCSNRNIDLLEEEKNNNENNENNNENNITLGQNSKLKYKQYPFSNRRQKRRPTKTRKRKEYPYLIKNKGNYIELIIFGDSFDKENTLPIYVKKGNYIKFKVNGKWRIDSKYEYTTSIGIPSSNSLNFNYGALVGRIGSCEPFLIKDDLIKKAENNGTLYLRMNLPKNVKVEPEGQLNLRIFDAEFLSVEEINKKIGWNDSSDLIMKKVEQSEIEFGFFKQLNNLRLNPVLFYEKNIEDYKNMINTKEYLYKFKNESFKIFSIHQFATKKINFYFEQFINDKNIPKQNVFSEVEKIEKNIDYYIGNIVGDTKYIVHAKIGKKFDSLEMCLLFLFDEDFREFIFNKEYTRVAIKIKKNFFNENHLILVCLFQGSESKFK